jgi:hypothetical protein
MENPSPVSRFFRRLAALLLGAGLLYGSPLTLMASELDSDAVAALNRSMQYLASLDRFAVQTENTLEVVLESGQKIQLDHAAGLIVQRPDKLRAERLGELVDQIFVYDGKQLTLAMPLEKVYAMTPAPDTIEEMLDFARNKLDIFAPGGDLIYRDAFDILMDGVEQALVVGQTLIAGVPCTHLAFRAGPVDWQIWIEEGDRPLPRKFVITSTDVVAAPQFAILMSNWDTAPEISPDLFTFTPAEDMQQIDFLLSGDAPAEIR